MRLLNILDRYFYAIVNTLTLLLVSFAFLAYVAVFDPQAKVWLRITVEFIVNLFTLGNLNIPQ